MPYPITKGLGTDGGTGNLLATKGYGGTTAAVTTITVGVIDCRTLIAMYSVPVNSSDATNPANYSVDLGLQVTEVKQETESTYVLTTTRQAPATLYTLTASNIHDLLGNLL